MSANNGCAGGAGSFWRSVAVVFSGTAIAQAVPLLGLLVLARLYAPSEFGVFAAWLGIVQVGSVLATGRFEVALALEEDGEARRIAVVATLAAVALATMAGAVVAGGLVLGDAAFIGQPVLWVLAVPAMALAATAQTVQAWAGADGRFRDLSTVRIVQSTAITGAQILVGLAAPTALGLACTHVLGLAAGIGVALSRQPLSLAPVSQPWPGAIRGFWSRQRRFPLISLPSDSVNTVAAQLPLLVLTSRFGADVAGQLALTMRVLGGPISLLGASVLDVFRRSASQTWRERGECRLDFTRTLRVLILGAIGLVLVIGPFGEALFALLFGETWRTAGTIALWLLPMFALRFVASPLSYMFYIAGKQHIDLAWQLALLAMTVATLTLFSSHPASLQAYSAGYSALYVVYLALSYRFSRGARA